MHILLADDNETNRMVASTILVEQGFNVHEVSNGRAALEAATARAYDLILMDVSMPEMDGLTAARLIRKLAGKLGAIPILAMTAHAMPGDRERCIAAGMDDHIAKPVNRAMLLTAIGRWLAVRPKPVNSGDSMAPASRPLDENAFARLAADVGAALLPDLIGSFIAEVRGRGMKISRAAGNADMPILRVEAQALAEVAETFGARHLNHRAAAIADAAAVADAATAVALTGSINQITDEAVEALMAKFSG